MRNVLIAGSGRSGTSMMASLFAAAGYFMGDRLLAAGPGNELGFFESLEVNGINEDLLDQVIPARSSNPLLRYVNRDRPRRFQRWLSRPQSAAYVLTVPADLERRMRAQCRPPYCLKDPRFCFTIDAWEPLTADAVRICVFRNPAETARSIVKQGRADRGMRDLRLDPHELELVWRDQYSHLLETADAARNEWVFISYEQLLADPEAVRMIAAQVAADLDAAIPDTSQQSVHSTDPVPDSCAEVYRELLHRQLRTG